MTQASCILWVRKDLRLSDNPALVEALKNYEAVIPVFIWAPEEESPWSPGEASKSWLHHSLKSFEKSLEDKGSKLIIRKGSSLATLEKLVKETSAQGVYWTRRYEPQIIKRDKEIKEKLTEQNLDAKSFNGSLLYEPWQIKNKTGKPYQVYTPFWNELVSRGDVTKPLRSPAEIKAPKLWPSSETLTSLKLLPKIKWDKHFYEMWEPGEGGAVKELNRFKEHVAKYADSRDIPGINGTSKLSPHLHFGEISPRRIWHSIGMTQKTQPYLKQIVWREFAHHLLYHFPKTPQENLRAQFDKFPWKKNKSYVTAWQKGKTGYPIVDAGMRELWTTGWMHNRVRMIVGSFLVKHLLQHWHEGAEWFWDTLVDADLANNTMGWQWIAGCGADAAPYFRVFNPMTQGEKFDKDGNYVKKWIPEISKLGKKWIHAPWTAPEEELSAAGIKLGKDYPNPIVDHSEGRKQALYAYEQIKN